LNQLTLIPINPAMSTTGYAYAGKTILSLFNLVKIAYRYIRQNGITLYKQM